MGYIFRWVTSLSVLVFFKVGYIFSMKFMLKLNYNVFVLAFLSCCSFIACLLLANGIWWDRFLLFLKKMFHFATFSSCLSSFFLSYFWSCKSRSCEKSDAMKYENCLGSNWRNSVTYETRGDNAHTYLFTIFNF